jgi:hypothetical protein
MDQGYRIQFHNASTLATKTRYIDRIVREGIGIELHPYNTNRGSGFVPVYHGSLLSLP